MSINVIIVEDRPIINISVDEFASQRAVEAAKEAKESEDQTALDRIATGEDRVQTGLDRVQTGLDRIATGLDRVATAADLVQTGLDRIATGEDRVQTGLDRVATGNDRIATGEDRAATAADKAQTGQDKTAAQTAATTSTEQAALSIAAKTASETAKDIAVTKASEASTSAQTATAQAAIATAAANSATSVILQGVYGVEWNKTFATTVCTRVGDMTLHNAVTGLPVHRKMRPCILTDSGVVNYYLNPDNYLLRADGFAALLNGTDGQVMIEIPEHWRRFDSVGDIQRAQISETSFRGAHRVAKCYVSAFEASVFRPTNKLSSVINLSTDYRGGNNTAAWDLEERTLLGRPATSISRTNFTTYARNRGAGWDQYLYEVHKTIFWLFTIEYATRNSQLAFNATLTADSFRQGGLGDGVTNIVSGTWSSFNSFNPFLACGAGGLSSATSSLAITHPTLGATQIPKYRGVENPFGHIWNWTEGINIRAGNARNMIYKANSRDYRSADYQTYAFAGDQATANGFIKELLFGEAGDILAGNTSGASASTFWADQLFQSIPGTGESLRGLLVGGSATFSTSAGLLCEDLTPPPSFSGANVGSRLCFMGV
jgi:hypothetical protein